VEQMLRILGLQHCRDTVVGNSLIRGISGGEKKRVTFGEMMMANFRVMCMDEISTGLDAAATLDIMKDITRSAELMKCTYLVALLQPAPEVVELFDDIILLREGQVRLVWGLAIAMALATACSVCIVGFRSCTMVPKSTWFHSLKRWAWCSLMTPPWRILLLISCPTPLLCTIDKSSDFKAAVLHLFHL